MKKNKHTNDRRQKAYTKSPSLISAENEDLGKQAKTVSKSKTNKKFIVTSPQSLYVEHVDLDQQNIGKERWFDESESMWLSSDTTSISLFFEEHRLSSPFHLLVGQQTISWLANLADSYLSLGEGVVFLDGQETNSMAALKKTPQEKQDEKTTINYQNDSIDSPIDIFQSRKSSTNPDYYSPISKMEKNSLLHSFEDSKWVSNYENTLLSNLTIIGVEDEKSQNDSSFQQDQEVVEPLFWPFEWEFDWTSQDINKYFAMSPQRYMIDMKIAYRDGRGKRLTFNTEKMESDVVKRVNSIPSIVRNSNKLDIKMEVADDPKAYSPNSIHRNKEFSSNQELPIENILGLNEFDGHEGIDFEFSEDIFSMNDFF